MELREGMLVRVIPQKEADRFRGMFPYFISEMDIYCGRIGRIYKLWLGSRDIFLFKLEFIELTMTSRPHCNFRAEFCMPINNKNIIQNTVMDV